MKNLAIFLIEIKMLSDIRSKLADPLLSPKEQLECRKLERKQLKYMTELRNEIQKLENKIKI
jgi:uncharacterized protein YlxW (UPF0749 family)